MATTGDEPNTDDLGARVSQWVPPPSDDPKEIQRFEEARREADALAASIKASLDTDTHEGLTLHQLVYLSHWSTLSDPADAPKRIVADELLIRARESFKSGFKESRLALFPIAAVFVAEPGARIEMVWLARAMRFDAIDARVLVERIEEAVDKTQEWWPDDAPERAPHVNRTYELATTVFAAVAVENARPRSDDSDPGSERYRGTIAQAHERLERAMRLLDEAGQRTATARYGRGMLLGTLLVAVVAGVMAGLLELADEDVVYALPLVAGALGAVVSVLQRMTAPNFRMDLESGHLVAFGAVRPFVGGVFGLLVLGLLEAELINLTPDGGSQVALYGVLAFAAGFNERFAQDALTSTITPTSSAPLGA
jgi:hypothetical protein